MPAMLRPNKKATKIAYAIIGEPINMRMKPTKKQQEISAMLLAKNVTFIR